MSVDLSLAIHVKREVACLQHFLAADPLTTFLRELDHLELLLAYNVNEL